MAKPGQVFTEAGLDYEEGILQYAEATRDRLVQRRIERTPMTHEWKDLSINPSRFENNFKELSQFGNTSDGGVNRTALSDSHLEARAWFRKKILEYGLGLKVDHAGNHSAILHCGQKNAATFLIGSHLDSVPFGGRFDGAIGVLAALEVLQVIKENNISLPVHLEAIDFTDEEGTLVGFLGSNGLTGKLPLESLQNPRGGFFGGL